VNLRLNLKYVALLAAALMLTVVMAFTTYAIIQSNIASAKSANAAYGNAGRGNDCETARGNNQICVIEPANDMDPGRSGGRNGGGG
jgi:hypothetical protein